MRIAVSYFNVDCDQWLNYSMIYSGPENMASDSEPRKFFSRPPRGPLRSHISGSKKPVRLLMSNDSAAVEVGQ